MPTKEETMRQWRLLSNEDKKQEFVIEVFLDIRHQLVLLNQAIKK